MVTSEDGNKIGGLIKLSDSIRMRNDVGGGRGAGQLQYKQTKKSGSCTHSKEVKDPDKKSTTTYR